MLPVEHDAVVVRSPAGRNADRRRVGERLICVVENSGMRRGEPAERLKLESDAPEELLGQTKERTVALRALRRQFEHRRAVHDDLGVDTVLAKERFHLSQFGQHEDHDVSHDERHRVRRCKRQRERVAREPVLLGAEHPDERRRSAKRLQAVHDAPAGGARHVAKPRLGLGGGEAVAHSLLDARVDQRRVDTVRRVHDNPLHVWEAAELDRAVVRVEVGECLQVRDVTRAPSAGVTAGFHLDGHRISTSQRAHVADTHDVRRVGKGHGHPGLDAGLQDLPFAAKTFLAGKEARRLLDRVCAVVVEVLQRERALIDRRDAVAETAPDEGQMVQVADPSLPGRDLAFDRLRPIFGQLVPAKGRSEGTDARSSGLNSALNAADPFDQNALQFQKQVQPIRICFERMELQRGFAQVGPMTFEHAGRYPRRSAM